MHGGHGKNLLTPLRADRAIVPIWEVPVVSRGNGIRPVRTSYHVTPSPLPIEIPCSQRETYRQISLNKGVIRDSVRQERVGGLE